PVCAGTSVTFTATPSNGGTTPQYQWKKGGTNITGATNETYSYIPLAGDAITCQLTSNATCPSGNPATSNTVTMTVNPLQTVGVSIAASANPVCAGTSVTFTATPSNGGTTPQYQWKKGGTNIPVCAGTSVTFTATPSNGGTTPQYQWKKGGTNITGATNATYSYIPLAGDAITCQLTSNATCSSGNPATSNTVTMTVNPAPAVPAAGTHVPAETQIEWNWNTVAGATGYKWSITNDYAAATDMLAATTKTETSLACGTAYTRYAWAYNACGNSTPVTLTQSTSTCSTPGTPCPGTPTVSYGGKTYNTVQIGTQCWLKENLNIGSRINGAQDQTNNASIEKYCYNDLESNCDIYGGLYQWGEVVQYLNGASNTTTWNPVPAGNVVGICPSGWHLPSDPEWCQLDTFLDPTVNCSATGWSGTDVGQKLKEAGNIHWAAPSNATNSSGFTALPAGMRYYNSGLFSNLSLFVVFWSTHESAPNSTWDQILQNDKLTIYRNNDAYKTNGLSVRCIKDDCPSAPVPPTPGTHTPSQTEIIWNWSTVAGATGYRWSITNDYAAATDMLAATTKTETGLTCSTAYTRYAWAYNACGNSTPVTLTQSTSICSIPGTPCPGT
ncbi:MAG: hypothetical protein NTW16_08660, partial [Bacteroidetes bacterium]|nr:hypothetical protein [Bacteroidota bacterium]